MLIKDIKKLEEFIEWLPELKDNQKFLLCLFARDKYNKSNKIKGGSFQLQRFVTDKSKMVNKIKRLESYLHLLEVNGKELDESSFGLYIKTNPTCSHRASLNFNKEIINRTLEGDLNYNPEVLLMDCFQNIKYDSFLLDLDIDFTSEDVSYDEVLNHLISMDFLNESAWINNIIRTRGGFHIQINSKEIQEDYRKTWRNKLFSKKSDLYTIGINDKNMIPLPGCNQFTYVPQLIKNK